MTRDTSKPWWPPVQRWRGSVVAGVCLWLAPFVVFLRHHDYDAWRPETLAALGLFLVVGVLSGLLMEVLGQYTRVLVWSFMVTLTVDIQMVSEERTAVLWIVFGGALIATSLARNYLPKYGAIIAAAVLAVSVFTPAGVGEVDTWVSEEPVQRDSSLPIYLHLILDEHIGVEGIPKGFDRDAAHARGLRDFYVDRGFLLFGRAFSQFTSTWSSLANMFNFDHRGFEHKHSGLDGITRYLRKNKYLGVMKERGYDVQIYQSAYLDYAYDKRNTVASRSVTYGLEVLSSIEGSDLSIDAKCRIILGVFSRLSLILTDVFKSPPSRLSTLSAVKMLEDVEAALLSAKPGEMYFVHLMLPHYPYTYDADCNVYADPWRWLTSHGDDVGERRRNTKASRAERYPLYLDQIVCLNTKLGAMFDKLDAAGTYDDMTIVVHSDHGSRICQQPPNPNISGHRIGKADYVDCFSTLFAFKGPGVDAGYDRRMLSAGALLEALVLQGSVPEGTAWAGELRVFFQDLPPDVGARPMPDFQRDLGD